MNANVKKKNYSNSSPCRSHSGVNDTESINQKYKANVCA